VTEEPRPQPPVAAFLSVFAPDGIAEIRPGDDLAAVLGDALEGLLQTGDVVAVTSKVVSKAEGRVVAASDREAAITAETVRVVASREHPGGVTRIVENRLGLVMAAAGVDASNTDAGTVLLLPEDPDGTARHLAAAWRHRFGVEIGVVITDTFGRPWREGQTDAAIGAAGVRVVDDLRGGTDASGRPLSVTVTAVADEIAAAADLVKGKTTGRPVAVVRGLGAHVAGLDEPGAARLVRGGATDMFRQGSAEAYADGLAAGRAEAARATGATASASAAAADPAEPPSGSGRLPA
jgi:coenzyme F420-0:L-glutamate ligase / coenzyme F420-1:gamma-L-glutamate ligase